MRCPYPGLYLPLSFTLSPLPLFLPSSILLLSLLLFPFPFLPLSWTHTHTHPRSHSTDTGPAIFRSGEEVYVVGRSQKRGYLVVEHGNRQIHVPHYCTELRVRTLASTEP